MAEPRGDIFFLPSLSAYILEKSIASTAVHIQIYLVKLHISSSPNI
jgi:hypothetical protein